MRDNVKNGTRAHILHNPICEPTIDIVAIHGLTGHWKASWTPSGSTYFWLQEAIPEACPKARVISYEHCGIDRDIIGNLILDLIDDRDAHNRTHMPLVIIAKSFGGTLAKQLFVESSPSRNRSPEAQLLHSCIRGFMFFSTVHTGGPSEDMRTLIRRSRSDSLQLDFFFDQVDPINKDFESLGGLQIPTVCFYETEPVGREHGSQIIMVPRESSTLPQAENRAIPCTHNHMAKFKDSSDTSLKKVMASLNRLIPKALGWSGVKVPQPEALRILCLDGGGVRGLFSVLVLEAIMEAVRQIDTPDCSDMPKPCNYFDLICGTSTGGILAIMLGRLRMDTTSCKREYRTLSREVFNSEKWNIPLRRYIGSALGIPWFSGIAFQNAAMDLIEQYLSAEEKQHLESKGIAARDAPLQPHSRDSGTACRSFVCALPDKQRECHRLRTYSPPVGESGIHCKIWQAAQATSAAPTFFPSVNINGIDYYDGGLESNNPILEAVSEGQAFGPIAAIVSIGTGSSKVNSLRGTGGAIFQRALGSMTDTETKHADFKRHFPELKDKYFRLQEEANLGEISLDAWEKLDEIENLAQVYLRSHEGKGQIKKCAEMLAKKYM